MNEAETERFNTALRRVDAYIKFCDAGGIPCQETLAYLERCSPAVPAPRSGAHQANSEPGSRVRKANVLGFGWAAVIIGVLVLAAIVLSQFPS
jgi:hypothetical protein